MDLDGGYNSTKAYRQVMTYSIRPVLEVYFGKCHQPQILGNRDLQRKTLFAKPSLPR
jgi:hypothetical protein